MKILQVITSLKTGGAETLVANMVPRLRALGHQVDVCVFNADNSPLLQQMREDGQTQVYELGHSFYNPWYIVRLARLMRGYDIVHTHNTSPQFFAAIAAKVLCSVVLCTTEHNTSNRRRGWRWYAPIDRWMYRQYQRIICISDQAEANLRKALGGGGFPTITTIYNGVDVECFHQALPAQDLMVGKERFTVVMVAGFRYQKDQDTLIRAMASLPRDHYELWLVGDGDRRSQLEALVAELGAREQVRFLSWRTDVPAVLKAADVVVMSSHFEGLSLSNIEGMSAGKPFVASDVDGLREVTDGYGVLFPHGDAQALAGIILRLADEPAYYQEVATRCYGRARQYDISKTVAAYHRVYEELGATSHA